MIIEDEHDVNGAKESVMNKCLKTSMQQCNTSTQLSLQISFDALHQGQSNSILTQIICCGALNAANTKNLTTFLTFVRFSNFHWFSCEPTTNNPPYIKFFFFIKTVVYLDFYLFIFILQCYFDCNLNFIKHTMCKYFKNSIFKLFYIKTYCLQIILFLYLFVFLIQYYNI